MAHEPTTSATESGDLQTVAADALDLAELIDIEKNRALLESFCEAVEIGAAIIDLKGEVLIGVRWQRICTDFHRVNEATCARCIESDTELANELTAGTRYSLYQCKNGMTDAASPIIIEGQHVANAFIGQFLLGAPDVEYFRNQAREFGLDEPGYLDALKDVPIVEEAKVPIIMEFLTSYAEMVATMGLEEMRRSQTEAELRKQEAELREHREHLEQQVAERTAELREITEGSQAQVAEESGLAALTSSLQGHLTVRDVAERGLSAVVDYLDAPVGLLFVLEDDGVLRRRAAHALPPDAESAETFLLGTGSIGQVAQSRKTSTVTPDEGVLGVAFGLTAVAPKKIVTIPMQANNALTGVLELYLFADLSERQARWIDKACEITATSLRFAQESRERELAEERTRLILESSGEGLFGLDTEGRATFVNPVACELLGYEPDELIGTPIHALVHHSRPDGSPFPIEECPMREAFTQGVVTFSSCSFPSGDSAVALQPRSAVADGADNKHQDGRGRGRPEAPRRAALNRGQSGRCLVSNVSGFVVGLPFLQ